MKIQTFRVGVFALFAFFCGNPVFAQSTNAPATTVHDPGVVTDLSLAGQDLYHEAIALKPFTTNGEATIRIGAGINTASKGIVVAEMITVPVSEHLAAGVVVAHIGSAWYEGGANVSYGVTNNWPVLGAVTAFAGDGIVYDFVKRTPANYLFTGFQKEWAFSPAWSGGIGGVLANTSDRSGVDALVGLHVTWHWGKKSSTAN